MRSTFTNFPLKIQHMENINSKYTFCEEKKTKKAQTDALAVLHAPRIYTQRLRTNLR